MECSQVATYSFSVWLYKNVVCKLVVVKISHEKGISSAIGTFILTCTKGYYDRK